MLFEHEESTDKEKSVDLSDMQAAGWWRSKRKWLNILTSSKLLTIHPVLLTKIKAGSNSYKSKYEIRQTLYILYQRNKIAKKVYSNLIKLL